MNGRILIIGFSRGEHDSLHDTAIDRGWDTSLLLFASSERKAREELAAHAADKWDMIVLIKQRIPLTYPSPDGTPAELQGLDRTETGLRVIDYAAQLGIQPEYGVLCGYWDDEPWDKAKIEKRGATAMHWEKVSGALYRKLQTMPRASSHLMSRSQAVPVPPAPPPITPPRRSIRKLL